MPATFAKPKKQTKKGSSKERTAASKATVGCLFSAIGGFTASFKQAGANVLWANEKDENAVKTFRHNFPDVRSIHKPVEELTVKADELLRFDEPTCLRS